VRRVGIFLLVTTIVSIVLFGVVGRAVEESVITGSFVQLNGQLASFSEEEWKTELGYMKAIGMDTVVVQYSAYGNRYYYPSRYTEETSGPGQDESINELVWKGTARARYVKIEIKPTSVEWTMLAEVSVSKNGEIVSSGKPYTISPNPNPKYPDKDGVKLTDGSANWSWNNMVGWSNPVKPITVVLDFGESTAFNSVAVKFMRSEISNVQLPAGGFSVFISNDGESFMPAGGVAWEDSPEEMGANAIGNILSAADELGMDVFVGLSLNPDYWSGKFDAREEAAMNQKIMTELHKLYGSHASFVGWYLPEELDDRNFNSADAKKAVKTYLKNMAMYARLYTKKPVMASPYFGMNPNGPAYAEWWREILSEAKIDIIAMQDGVGCHRTTAAESAAVLRALRPVLKEYSVQLWANVEVFDQTHGWPVDDLGWKATSASMDRVSEQLRLESPYVDKIIIFDFTSYMSPRLGGVARELYEGYEAYLSRRYR